MAISIMQNYPEKVYQEIIWKRSVEYLIKDFKENRLGLYALMIF